MIKTFEEMEKIFVIIQGAQKTLHKYFQEMQEIFDNPFVKFEVNIYQILLDHVR